MSFKKFGHELMLAARLVLTGDEAVEAQAPEMSRASESIRRDADAAFKELDAKKREPRQEVTSTDLARFMMKVLSGLMETLRPDSRSRRGIKERVPKMIGQAAEQAGENATPTRRCEAVRVLAAGLRARLVVKQGPRKAPQPGKVKFARVGTEVVARPER